MILWRLAVALGIAAAAAALAPLPPAGLTEGGWVQPRPKTVNLLPRGPIDLFPNDFDDDSKPCTDQHVLRVSYEPFALPSSPQLQLRFRGKVWCGAAAGAAQRGALLAAGPLDVVADCTERSLTVTGGAAGQISVPLSMAPGSNDLEFVLAADPLAPQPLALQACLGAPITSSPTTSGPAPPALAALVAGSASLLEQGGLSVGPRESGAPGVRAYVEALSLVSGHDFAPFATCPFAATAPPEANALPEIVSLTAAPAGATAGDPGWAEVEQEVVLAVKAVDLDVNDAVRLSLTVYGLPPEGCNATTCGDATFFSGAPAGGGDAAATAEVAARVQFPLPGRYVVRARAADGSGAVAVQDLAVVVRKKEDARGAAPCCRHTPYIVAHNLGRPVDRTVFRAAASAAAAVDTLGWAPEYWAGADLEAERLFDYGILAPPESFGQPALDVLTCADVRVAGAGSPEVFGLLASRGDTRGHNQKLTIIPEAFPWAKGDGSDVEVQAHWSGWHRGPEAGRHARSVGGQDVAAVGCTAAGTQRLIQATGMVDQYNQALIQQSYGALSLAPGVAVLPEVEVPRGGSDPGDAAPSSAAYAYYDRPAREALAAAPGARPWMHLILAPLARHQPPKHRAWSGGPATGGATVTKCYASQYYAVHETGHRMGFKHGSLRRLAAGHAAPADPLGPGELVKDESYGCRLDLMSCCRSDFGMYHRTVAGWMKGSGRAVLGAAELGAPGARRLVLWPFDRSESRGKLLTLALRRSKDEILLVGFRTASHWEDPPAGGAEGGAGRREQSRLNVRGLQVEYLRRDASKGPPGSGAAWAERALLDFNALHGDEPAALAPAPGELAADSHAALLKEGRAWYDAASRVLLTFERVGPCDSPPGVNPYPHAVEGFYGYGGEWPGQERFEKMDFRGFETLECAHITVTTAAPPPPPEPLLPEVSVGGPAATVGLQCVGPNGEPYQPPLAQQAQQACIGEPGGGAPALPLVLAVRWPEGIEVTAVVWKDRWNMTLAAPPREALAGQSAAAVAVPSSALPVSVALLAADGRHSRVEIASPQLLSENEYALNAQYRSYGAQALTDEVATLGTLPRCVTPQTVVKGKDYSAMYIAIYVLGGFLGVLALGGAVAGLAWWRRRRRQAASAAGGEAAKGGEAGRRRTTTPAALAAAAAAG